MLGKSKILHVSKVSRINLYLLVVFFIRLKPILTTKRRKVNTKKNQLQCEVKQEVVKKVRDRKSHL